MLFNGGDWLSKVIRENRLVADTKGITADVRISGNVANARYERSERQ